MLCASVDDEQVCTTPWPRRRTTGGLTSEQAEATLGEVKAQVRQVLRKLTRNSEAQASIESGQYTIQYVSLPKQMAKNG